MPRVAQGDGTTTSASGRFQWLEERITHDDEFGFVAPRQPHPHAVRSIGVIGGGTAGFFAALALRAQRPDLDVTLVESSAIPIIGVGEATVPVMLLFLHRMLGIDLRSFYAEVQPTWKFGIRFDWGVKGDYHFQAPFDWNTNSIGVLGSLAARGDINSMTIEAMMMERDVVPVFRNGRGSYTSLLHSFPFAYHLDNVRLVRYLHRVALQRGVRYLDRKISEVVLRADGEEVDHLRTPEGERLSFDLYIDCTGFRSLLLEQTLGSPFVSYESSLFTDRAIAFEAPHGGHIKPYTSAITMRSGWTWNIPMVDEDHLGYVFCSAYSSEAQAEREARARFPGMGTPRLVRFKSGRHQEAWKGNVVAIGNSYAFVEPLESTGLLMVSEATRALIALLPRSRHDRAGRAIYNASTAKLWDGLRWFLAAHYKFNRKVSSPFWRAVRAETDSSGIDAFVDTFRERGPLNRQPGVFRQRLSLTGQILFYGFAGLDCILLGQKVAARLPPSRESLQQWRLRERDAAKLLRDALSHRAALDVVQKQPEFLERIFTAPDGWVQKEISFGSPPRPRQSGA